jgi:hypothetical protein
VEIKAIDPPKSVKDAMEKQMRAEREKRAAVLTAEGGRQAAILSADGDKQSAILRAEGDKQSSILRAEGQAQAITHVFQSIHRNDPDPKLLAYQYLQTLPQLAQGPGNTFWVIPSEVTTALKAVTSAFGGTAPPPEHAPAGAVSGAAEPAAADDDSTTASGEAAIASAAATAAVAAGQRATAALEAAGITLPGQPGGGNGTAKVAVNGAGDSTSVASVTPSAPGDRGAVSGEDEDRGQD